MRLKMDGQHLSARPFPSHLLGNLLTEVKTNGGLKMFKMERTVCAKAVSRDMLGLFKKQKPGIGGRYPMLQGLPRGHGGKEFICQCRRPEFNPWVRKIP